MKEAAVFKRVYRMDSWAEFAWSQVCQRVRVPGQCLPQPRPEGRGDTQKIGLRREYMQCVLDVHQVYSVDLPQVGMGEDGEPRQNMERKFFQVLGVVAGRSRPKLMPTIETEKDVAVRARLAFSIQDMSVRPVADDANPDGTVVFQDSDSMWMRWDELAPFPSVRKSLTRYQCVVGSNQHAHCMVLSEALVALPPYAVTDLRCPTLCILDALRDQGWRATRGRVEHTDLVVGVYDGRDSKKMKVYLICVHEMARPSDEVLLFYNVFLRGQRVEPGQSHAQLKALTGGGEDDPKVPIEDENESSEE